MKLYLFAIGGTGARVVRSLTMLLAAGIDGLDSSVEVVPVILDYDLSNGDKTRTLETLKTYNRINNALYPRGAHAQIYTDNFFMTRITSLNDVGVVGANPLKADYQMFFGYTGDVQKFSGHLDTASMTVNPAEQDTLNLIKCLYDDSLKGTDTELELDMTVGFKGSPNIGSVVFHDIDQTSEFKRLVGSFTADDRIFVVSSIFGGTGSSGFPEIVNAIRNCTTNDALQQADIGAVVMLPYFGLLPPAGGNAAIDANSFNAKTVAALTFYSTKINSEINSLYYVGDTNHDNMDYSEGGASQTNPAHVAEFVAATSIIDFLKNRTPHQPGEAYEFGIRDGKQSSHIDYNDFYDGAKNDFLKRLCEFAFAMKYYRDAVCGDRKQVSPTTAYYSNACFNLGANRDRGVYKDVSDFLQAGSYDDAEWQTVNGKWGFYPWLSELSVRHEHKLSLFHMDKKVEMRSTFPFINQGTKHPGEIRGTLGSNPVSDDNLKGKLNKLSQNLGDGNYNAASFFKILRTLSQEICQNYIR